MQAPIRDNDRRPAFPRPLDRGGAGIEEKAAQPPGHIDHHSPPDYAQTMPPIDMEGPAADRALVLRARGGDASAVEALVVRIACVSRFLRGLNRRLMRPIAPTDLEDLIQSAMTTIWSKLDKYKPERPLEAWMYGICSLEIRKGIESRRRSERVELAEEADAWPASAALELGPALEYEALHRSLDRLRPEYARIIRLVHFEERSFSDVAEALGINRNTVKTHYYRGLHNLRDALAQAYPEEASQ